MTEKMIEVIKGGLYTTIQDYPGRIGYWSVGIPPSGPMDAFAFRVANRLVGNPDCVAGLEITAIGPKLRFLHDAVIALTGAELDAEIDGQEVPWWEPFAVKSGSILTLGRLRGFGYRSYLAVSGGIDVPEYLGSKSTFTYGGFGGLEGRILKAGDVISIQPAHGQDGLSLKRLPDTFIPAYSEAWEIAVVPGPHESPDFFTDGDVDMFYSAAWRVHYNSNRLGYRLEGPRPEFSRKDGGDGGSHPSNIPDCAYAIGTINFSGDVPIIITADGPSLGGFISIGTIPTAELWKVGQARPGDKINFKKISVEEAVQAREDQEKLLNMISGNAKNLVC